MKLKKLWHVLVFCLGIMLMFFALEEGLGFLEDKFFPDIKASNPYFWDVIDRLIFTFIGIFILKKLGKINILKDKSKGFWRGVLIGSVVPILSMLTAFTTMTAASDISLQPLNVIITIILTFLMVGVYEEILHRGIILGVIDDYFGYKSASGVWKTVILSGFFFGIFHFLNFWGGRAFLYVFNQVISCIGMGIFFSAVYMRSRNLYSLIFLHAVYDVFVMSDLFTVGTNLVESGASQAFDWISTIIQLIVYILFAMFLLRKKKMAEIINYEPDKLSLDPKCS